MKLGHVHIKVTDLERSKAYYIDVLGMRLVEELAGSGSATDSVLYHIAFEVQSVKSLKQVKTRLETNGYPVSPIDHGISWALYTKDPDGNGVEIYMDRRESEGGVKLWNGRSKPLRLS